MSDVFSQINPPITDYRQFAPKAPVAPEPLADTKPDYAQQRIKLEEQKKATVDDPEIAKLQEMQKEYERLAGIKTPVPKDPTLKEPAAAPKLDFTDPIKAFQSPAVLIATLGSFFSRAPMTAALNAGAEAMKAYHKGEAEVFVEKRKEWEENLKVALEKNKIALEKYNAEWKKSDAAVKDKQAKMIALAAGEKMQTLVSAIEGNHFKVIDGILEGLEKAQQKGEDSLEAMKKAIFMANYRADLDVKKTEERERIKLKMSEGVVDPETRHFMALQLIDGNYSALTGLFRTQGAKLAVEREAKDILTKERGMDPDKAAALVTTNSNKFMGERRYQQTAGGYAARVESASNEVEQLLPQAMEASKALPRGKFVPVNKLVQAFEAGTSDPAYYDFINANFSLMNAYARAMNPTGTPHVNDRLEAHALGVLSVATDQKAYEVQARRLWKEVQASKKAQERTREGLAPAKEFPGGESSQSDWKQLSPDVRIREVK